MWWYAQSEFQTITHSVLQDNEYYDVEADEKQDPYKIKLVGSEQTKEEKKKEKRNISGLVLTP